MSKPNCFCIYSFLLLSLFISTVSGCDASDSQDVSHDPLFIKGHYKDLLKKYQYILGEAKAHDIKDIQYANALENVAILYYKMGLYTEAEPLYKRALSIYDQALGPDHPDVATSLNNLAELYRHQARYTDAEPLYKRALLIYEKSLNPEHPDVAMGLNNLALLYVSQARYTDAEPLYKRALLIFEKSLNPEHPNVAMSLNNLALLYVSQIGRASCRERV